jgi:hypothetical protein
MLNERVKIVLLFILLLAAADIGRSFLTHAISTPSAHAIPDLYLTTWLHLLSDLLCYGLAGALIALAAKPRLRLPLAVLIGLIPALALRAMNGLAPWLAQSHGTTYCFEVLSWANVYMSTVASTLGGLAGMAIGRCWQPKIASR